MDRRGGYGAKRSNYLVLPVIYVVIYRDLLTNICPLSLSERGRTVHYLGDGLSS